MTSPNWGFDLLVEGGGSNATLANKTIEILDIVSHLSVIDRGLTAEPGSPTNGDAYILPATHTGTSWAGFAEDDLAIYFTNYGWLNFTPVEGWRSWVEDEDIRVVFDGTNWVPLTGLKRYTKNVEGGVLGGEFDLVYLKADWTISAVRSLILGSGSQVDWNLEFDANRSAASPSTVFSGTQSTTSKTTGNTHTVTTNPTADNYLWLAISTVTGSIDTFSLNIEYSET